MANKVAVVYLSNTGHTAAMAEAVVEGAENTGLEVELFEAADFDADSVSNFDALAFGCPASGTEELEANDFAPLWDDCLDALGDKKVVLFGSWGWGAGEYMESWKESAEDEGISIVDTYTCNDEPDEAALDACRELASKLA